MVPKETHNTRRSQDVSQEEESDDMIHGADEDEMTIEDLQGFEEEFHTDDDEEDQAEETLDKEVVVAVSVNIDGTTAEHNQLADAEDGPYLPARLLASKPTEPVQQAETIPWAEMTRKEKRKYRTRLRQRQKRQLEQMRAEATASGALKAGRVAQIRRGISPAVKRARNFGAARKETRPIVSGRQKLLQERKQLQQTELATRPSKRSKSKR